MPLLIQSQTTLIICVVQQGILKMVEDDLKTTKEICKKLNYSEKWALDNHYISVMESEKELNHAMSLVRYDYTDCCKALLDSLKKQ